MKETNLDDFNGLDSTGNWQVCVGDAGAADTGALCPTTMLNITAGPAPDADAVVNPAAGALISFGSGVTAGTATVTISNDAGASLDLTNINCSFAGGDAGNFSVDTPMPAGPIAAGGSLIVQLSGTVSQGESLSSSLTCTYDGDNDGSSSTWPVVITGEARVIPSLNTYGLLALIALFMFGAVVVRRKFI